MNKPTIRTKTRDPKQSDFSKQELIININEGSLFYKSNLGVHKLLPSSTVAVSPTVVIPPTPAIWTETGDDIYYDTGKVGIGTSSPTQTLSVAGHINLTSNTYGLWTRKVGAIDVNGLSLYNQSNSGIDISDNGDVGIGTETPGEKLELNGNLLLNTGNIRSTGDINLITDDGAQHAEDKAFINLSGDNVTGAITTIYGDLNLVSNHTLSAPEIATRTTGLPNPPGFPDVNAAFGTPTGIGHLTVNGDIQSQGYILAGASTTGVFESGNTPPHSIGSSGWFFAFGSGLSSDKSLKKNIVPLEDSLNKILSLRGVNFEWKDNTHGKGTQHGFIAQEIQEIIPDLAIPGLNDKLAVNYIGVIPLLVEAIKTQQKQIDELKEKLK